MTSVLRRYAQIDQSVQFFSLFANCTGWTLSPSEISSPSMSYVEFATAYAPSLSITTASTKLLKDLGRQIMVYNPNVVGSPHIAIFREVMLVNGANREGISNMNAYICVWADRLTFDAPTFGAVFANVTPALVARTGH